MADPVEALKSRVDGSSQAQVASDFGVTQQYISAILTKNRKPSKRILEALGFERAIVYRKRR